MPKRNLPQPTAAELEILSHLWKHGPATVREIHDEIKLRKPTAYTTTLKILQNMDDKGLVKRDKTNRAHVYRAKLERETTQRNFANDLLQKVFGGSAEELILRVLESKSSDAEELAAIRRIIDEAEKEAGKT
ncbi:MAG: BlaI/MecI/CopY family transcriptional regulator [Acidobacteria bacterium]|nr:BlaI/MecI/CopY family transcriptional regulator [Acidobacteriota bacterium]